MLDNIRNIQETLRTIVTEYGEEILQDSNELSAILCDMAPDQKKARMLLMLALDEGIGEYYVNTGNMPKERIISRTLDSLSTSFSEDRIQDITAVLFYALGWDTAIVMVYFEEYIKRKAPAEQILSDIPSEEKPAAGGLDSKEQVKREETEMQDDRGEPPESPIDLREQVGELKKRISVLLVIIVLILVGILIFSILAWSNTRKPAPDAEMLQFDLNQDGAVDSTDAAVILGISAKMGVSGDSELNESFIRQADVNGDASVDASDAAHILLYAAYAGSGNAGLWQNS